MQLATRPIEDSPFSFGLMAVGLALAVIAFGWAGQHAGQTRRIRCYEVRPPLTQAERGILAGPVLTCWSDCRAVLKLSPNRGVACYIPLLRSRVVLPAWAGRELISEWSRSALRIPSGR